jgi:hypothetical protein
MLFLSVLVLIYSVSSQNYRWGDNDVLFFMGAGGSSSATTCGFTLLYLNIDDVLLYFDDLY